MFSRSTADARDSHFTRSVPLPTFTLCCFVFKQCWCAVNADLTRNGEVLDSDECDMLCGGTTTGELCGGDFKMSAYEMEHDDYSGYMGCYKDGSERAMNAEGKYAPGDMTNQVSLAGSKTLHIHVHFLASPTSTKITDTVFGRTRGSPMMCVTYLVFSSALTKVLPS